MDRRGRIQSYCGGREQQWGTTGRWGMLWLDEIHILQLRERKWERVSECVCVCVCECVCRDGGKGDNFAIPICELMLKIFSSCFISFPLILFPSFASLTYILEAVVKLCITYAHQTPSRYPRAIGTDRVSLHVRKTQNKYILVTKIVKSEWWRMSISNKKAEI